MLHASLDSRRVVALFAALAIAASGSAILPARALAQGQEELRAIRLSDGRTLRGVVIESTPEGMRIRVPQGTALVGYSSLVDMANIDSAQFMAQGPMKLALAPITGSGGSDAARLAAASDDWLARAASVVPRSEVTSAAAWKSSLGDGGTRLSGCRGDLNCVRAHAGGLGVEFVLVPSLEWDGGRGPASLRLLGIVLSTGQAVGDLRVPLPVLSGMPPVVDRPGAAESVLQGVFFALGLSPEIDVAAAATAARLGSPESAGLASAAGGSGASGNATGAGAGDPQATRGAGGGRTATGDASDGNSEGSGGSSGTPGTAVAATAADGATADGATGDSATLSAAGSATAGAGAAAGASWRPLHRRAVALGFVPVPGLASAYLRDLPGFAVSLVGTFGSSWAAVYAIGASARSAEAFWIPSILVPLVLNAAVNEICVAVGWKRLYAPGGRRAALRLPMPAVSPLVSPKAGGAGSTVTLGISGGF